MVSSRKDCHRLRNINASTYALALFARDRFMTADRGLTLVDTKYDFGADGNSNITVVNEIH